MFELIESGSYGPDNAPHNYPHQGYSSGFETTERDD